jgi:uncharacterized repeat protein (TIGR01451 family)
MGKKIKWIVLIVLVLLTAVLTTFTYAQKNVTAPQISVGETAVYTLPPSPRSSLRQPLPPNPIHLQKEAPSTAAPGSTITYRIWLDNIEAVSHTFSLTDTLPSGLAYIAGSASNGLLYDDLNSTLTWQGELGPGTRGYHITTTAPLTYVNLGDLGAPNLCQQTADCDDGSVQFTLNGDSLTFYDEVLTQINVSANGFLFGAAGLTEPACVACPQPLPRTMQPNQLIAGLWRDVDTSAGIGQWYGGLLVGWLPNPADIVFYANWHEAAQFTAPFVQASHAIAIVLDGQSEPAGRIYFVYDEVAPEIASFGYTVGVENSTGTEGATFAFTPCSEQPCLQASPVGDLPAAGTTLRLDPAVVGGSSARLFTFQAQVTAAVGTEIVNEVTAVRTDSQHTVMATAVTTIIYTTYLPLIAKQ